MVKILNKELLVLLFFLLIGIVFLGSGITGMVVSETCCFPPDCSPENMCVLEKQSANTVSAVGFALVIFFAVYIVHKANQ